MNVRADYSGIVKKYGEGFFAVYQKAQRVAAYGKDIKALWKELKDKNIDAQKVVIMRLPPDRWRYQS
ncbi:MAG: hypothetical protein ABID04_02720 [Patescibacteria group bacterium]